MGHKQNKYTLRYSRQQCIVAAFVHVDHQLRFPLTKVIGIILSPGTYNFFHETYGKYTQ